VNKLRFSSIVKEDWDSSLSKHSTNKRTTNKLFYDVTVKYNEPHRFYKRTSEHFDSVFDPDAQILVDCDMSILGSSPERYGVYLGEIRREFSFISDKEFARGRAEFLGRLLSSGRIFVTDEIRMNLENEPLKTLPEN